MVQRIVAAVVAAVCLTFFVLTQIANVVAIAHLPKDLREAIIEMSNVPPLLAWLILALGVIGAGYLLHDLWGQSRAPSATQAAKITSGAEQRRDWPLRDLFAYLGPYLPLRATETEDDWSDDWSIGTINEGWEAIGDEVLKQLSTGRLHAIGRKHQKFRRLQPAPIPPEFWRTAKFTYWFLDRDGQGLLHAKNDDGVEYTDIEVDRGEALEIWPNSQTRKQA